MTTTTTTKKDIEATVGDDGTLILEFRHGETLRVHPETLAPEIQRAALLHGLKQKLTDALVGANVKLPLIRIETAQELIKGKTGKTKLIMAKPK